MSDQLQKWQQQYQSSTPVVNSQALMQQIKAKRKSEKVKAWTEMIFGLLISLYCLVAMLYFAEGWQTAVVYGVLSPIPFCFSLWSFKNRQKQWQQASLNTQDLLNIKCQDAMWQEKYWRISAIVVTTLWLLLVIMGAFTYLNYADLQAYLWLVGVNAIVVLVTLVKYYRVRRALPASLRAINELQK